MLAMSLTLEEMDIFNLSNKNANCVNNLIITNLC